MARKKSAASSGLNSEHRPPPEALAKYCWPKGVSGNPAGGSRYQRARPLTDMMINFLAQLDPKDLEELKKWNRKKKHGKRAKPPVPLQHGQKFIREWYERAMDNSDILMLAILERSDGKLAPDTEKERKAERPYSVVVMDVPRPPRPVAPNIPIAKILPSSTKNGDES